METDIPISSTSGISGNLGEASSTRRDQRSVAQSSGATGMREELANLKTDLDALMSHASTLTETELREARDRMLARFSSMRHAARGMAAQAGRQFSQGRDITVDYVRDKPLQSVAIAAGAGLLLGLLLRARLTPLR